MKTRPTHRVLVLNRLWQAVNIVAAPRAFSLLFQDHAKVIHSHDGAYLVYDADEWLLYSEENPPETSESVVRTVRLRIRVPKILLLNQYDRLPVKEVRFTRQNLFARDNHICQYCGGNFGSKDLNLDHVIPRDRGGRSTWENIVTACQPCNSRKANRLPHEAGMRLLRKPNRPSWRPFVTIAAQESHEKIWAQFLHISRSA